MAAPLSVAVIQLDEARLFSPFTLKQLIHLKVLIYQNDQNICKYSASLITTYQKANTAFVGKLIKNEIRRFPPVLFKCVTFVAVTKKQICLAVESILVLVQFTQVVRDYVDLDFMDESHKSGKTI